jgi:hypothetical protein
MLSEKLGAISSRSDKAQCRIPQVLKDLPNDDKSALIAALVNTNVSVRAICNALNEEGITVSRDAVTRARLCVTDSYPCKCDLPKTGEK